jgi:hypothetical protein
MDNAAYHKVRLLTEDEKKIFGGRSFSKLKKAQYREYLTLKGVSWEEDWLLPKLKEEARQRWDEGEPAITAIANEYGHIVEFLPPYHSDLNPIENVWGIIKGHVAQHRTKFSMAEVECLVREGFALVTPAKWKKCVERAERIEKEMFVEDVRDYVHLVGDA